MTILETVPGIIAGMDEEVYHSRPELSSTQARQLLRAPKWFDHSRTAPRVHKAAFDVGTAAHTKVLGTGWPLVAIPEALLSADGGIRTAAAKAWVEEARVAGRIPLKNTIVAEVNAMSESVLANATARTLLEQEGIPEASVFGTDPVTEVDVRARFDFLGRGSGRRVGVDLKTLRGDATPSSFARTVAERGYHVQDGWYTDSLEFAGEQIDAFAFICVEKEAPYLTATFVLDDDYREMGRAAARRARELYRRGMDSGTWPGHPDQIQIVRPPQFVIYDHIDSLEAAA